MCNWDWFLCGPQLKVDQRCRNEAVSNTEEDGRVTWPMREVAFLACPTAKLSVKTSSVNKAVSTEQPEYGTTNGKKQKLFSKCEGPTST